MYEYIWDTETGGLLLTTNQSKFSKEPRPVYYKELDILGFDKYWNYSKDDSAPIMWAEANNYIYMGRNVAKTKGGTIYTKPEIIILDDPEPNGKALRFVDIDIMCQKNRDVLETLVQDTIQKIYNTYIDYRDKIDLYYVAFSGGKDSVVTLDLVQRALPNNSFNVVFGDTQMEFPDTYSLVEEMKKICAKKKIDFFVAKSEHSPDNTWNEFGPPSQTIRWCCSVHKTAPQILLLRRITANPAFRGMAFTGIRADESVSRSQYDSVSYGDKHKGQYSYHTILNWSSAEVFLYIYDNNLLFNETYKKGNSRAGCLVCPMATNKNFFFKEKSYGVSGAMDDSTTTKYNNIILNTTSKVFSSEKDKKEFMETCGWKARRSGRELNFSEDFSIDNVENGILTIKLLRERTDWRQWIKTLGDITELTEDHISIIFQKKHYTITYSVNGKYQTFSVDISDNTKEDIYFTSGLKTIFRKSAYCIGCHVCEVNCPHGYITMSNGNVLISDNCVKCKKCHEVFHGCLVSNSLRLPKGVLKMGSIDRYGNIGIEYDWVVDYFSKKDDFWENNELGTNKIKNLKSFLTDAEVTLIKKNTITSLGEIIDSIGIETEAAWGILLTNLAYTSEINWWIMNTEPNNSYSPSQLITMLSEKVSSENSQKHIVSAYKNIFASNDILGRSIGLGKCTLKEGSANRVLIEITRLTWQEPIPEVILYSLYKFAEACGGYYQFSLSILMDNSIERDGISPTRIFGLDREKMIALLNGLSTHYPDFIHASFTLDLETITLKNDKKSEDVLSLF